MFSQQIIFFYIDVLWRLHIAGGDISVRNKKLRTFFSLWWVVAFLQQTGRQATFFVTFLHFSEKKKIDKK
jgi:hypothetical protein